MIIKIIGNIAVIIFILFTMFILLKNLLNLIILKGNLFLGKTSALIDNAELITDNEGDKITNYKYSYVINNKKYRGSQINILGDFQIKRKAIKEFIVNQKVEITYFKKFPYIAWIQSEFGKIQIFGNAALVIFLLILTYIEIIINNGK